MGAGPVPGDLLGREDHYRGDEREHRADDFHLLRLGQLVQETQREQINGVLRQVRENGGVTVGLSSVHDRVRQLRLGHTSGTLRTPAEVASALFAMVMDPMDFVASRFGETDIVKDHPEVRSIWSPAPPASCRDARRVTYSWSAATDLGTAPAGSARPS